MIITLAPGPTPPATRGNIFLPIVATPPLDPVAEFVRLLTTDLRQQRPRLSPCPRLETAATWRAEQLAAGELFAHKTKAGVWANEMARMQGCDLPESYGNDANYIESLCAGSDNPNTILAALANSPNHKAHLFGENDFFREQRHLGVAMAENADSPYVFYWAIWIAICR